MDFHEEGECNEFTCTPPDVTAITNSVLSKLLPQKSPEKYEKE